MPRTEAPPLPHASRATGDGVAALLEGALGVWRISATVEPDPGDEDAVLVRTANGLEVRVARRIGDSAVPFWEVREGGRVRSHPSVRGMLRSVRAAVDPAYTASRLIISPRPPVS